MYVVVILNIKYSGIKVMKNVVIRLKKEKNEYVKLWVRWNGWLMLKMCLILIC